MIPRPLLAVAVIAIVPIACTRVDDGDDAHPYEAISLLGDTLQAPPMSDELRAEREAQLEEARTAYEALPDDPDALIWYGRRTAYLGRYREAIGIFTVGIERHPGDARLYRHRGHRFITIRDFPSAIEDFERAVQLTAGQPDAVEPDGLPNAAGIPTSTLQSNIWYHLGLAYYLSADWSNALRAYEAGQEVSRNDDMRVAMTYWHVMTLARLDRDDDARALMAWVTPNLELLENHTYRDLLLLFRGLHSADDVLDTSEEADVGLANATAGYGVGFWHWWEDRADEAIAVWERTVAGPVWAGFGYIAAEAELARRARGAG